MSSGELRVLIDETFRSVKRPKTYNARNADFNELKTFFWGPWQTMPPDAVDFALRRLTWPLLSGEGLRYYLPAVLTRIVNIASQKPVLKSAPFAEYALMLYPIGFKSPKPAFIDNEMRDVVRKVVEYLEVELPDYFDRLNWSHLTD